MVTQVSKPGVNIRQVFEGTVPTPTTPQLVPCVVGPAFEVVDLFDASGIPAEASKATTTQGALVYTQLPVHVPVAEFPTPHADPAQMSVLSDEVSALLATSGTPRQLSRSSAFLTELNLGCRPGIFVVTDGAVRATSINLAIDAITRDAVSADFHITVAAGDTDAQLVDKINAAVGSSVASVRTDAERGDGILIESSRFGAGASVTLRKSSSGFASTFLNDVANFDKTVRVEGAGLYAEDNALPNMTTSPFVKHSTGLLFATSTTNLGNNAVLVATLNESGIYPTQRTTSGELVFGQVDAVDFTELKVQAATATSDGDMLTATNSFGQSISSVMIIGVEAERLRLGVVDTLRSVYDAEGNPSAQRYVDFALNELLSGGTPFAPKNGFIVARALPNTSTATAATWETDDLSVAAAYLAATPASVAVADVTDESIAGAVGLVAVVRVVVAGVETQSSYTVKVSDTLAEIANTLDAALSGVSVSVAGNTLTVETLESGADVLLALQGPAWGALGTVGDTVLATDHQVSDIAGGVLRVGFNGGAVSYRITAQSDSLVDLVSRINGSIGLDVAELTEADGVVKLKITSPLVGIASSVQLGEDLAETLQFADANHIAGEGRPLPELGVDPDGAVHVRADVLRNAITGKPMNAGGNLHIGYRALRTDLSADAAQPGILRVSNISDLDSIYGPIDVRNPLALGIYFALLNAGDGVEVNALGVDAVSSSEPLGTIAAYARALEFLRGYEVYAVAPLTSTEDVIALCDAHVKDMSEPSLRGERVLISAPVNPVRRNDVVVLSAGAAGADSTGNVLQVDLNDSPEAVLAESGVDTSGVVPFELDNGQQLYLTLVTGGETYRLSVKSVDGARITLRDVAELTTAQNADGFYTGSDIPSSFAAADFSLALRGTRLTLPGSSRLDKTAYAETVRDKAQQYLNRRQLRLYPDTVVSSAVGGIARRLPSFYWAAALAGASANLPAQEPFTRVPLVGFSDVVGPLLDRGHYDTISAGNSVIESESAGLTPALRIQSTTDPSTIESREWSVTRAVDLFAKTVRGQLRGRIGRFNITQSYMDELTLLVDSLCTSAVAAGLFRAASVTKLEQDPQQPDTVLVAISVEVLFPANYIDVTIVV